VPTPGVSGESPTPEPSTRCDRSWTTRPRPPSTGRADAPGPPHAASPTASSPPSPSTTASRCWRWVATWRRSPSTARYAWRRSRHSPVQRPPTMGPPPPAAANAAHTVPVRLEAPSRGRGDHLVATRFDPVGDTGVGVDEVHHPGPLLSCGHRVLLEAVRASLHERPPVPRRFHEHGVGPGGQQEGGEAEDVGEGEPCGVLTGECDERPLDRDAESGDLGPGVAAG